MMSGEHLGPWTSCLFIDLQKKKFSDKNSVEEIMYVKNKP